MRIINSQKDSLKDIRIMKIDEKIIFDHLSHPSNPTRKMHIFIESDGYFLVYEMQSGELTMVNRSKTRWLKKSSKELKGSVDLYYARFLSHGTYTLETISMNAFYSSEYFI